MQQLWRILAFLVSLVTGQIPVSSFYSYGNQAGDSVLSQNEASTKIPILFDYPFFGSTYQEVHISTNGIITFGAGMSTYIPVPFPVQGTKCIATYWTNSDPSRGGPVFYRETYDANILDQVSQEIRTRLIQYSSFTSKWALIITFDKVPAYGCSSSNLNNCTSLCSKVVTYQAILTSNGINSLAIFNYNKLDYTVGTASCHGYAQIGFNAGDGKRFHLVESSNTLNIANVGLMWSNVGIPGKWIFATDGEDIMNTNSCNTNALLEIVPRKVVYFGGEDISILGPCFGKNDTVILVLFEQTPIICQIKNGVNALCSLPLLDKPGRNSVTLTHNSFVYNSFIIAVGADDITVMERSFEVQNTDNPIYGFNLHWNSSSDGDGDLVFKGFERNYYLGKDGSIVYNDTAALNYGAFPDTGRVTLRPLNKPIPSNTQFGVIFRTILVVGIRNGVRAIAGIVIQTIKTNAQYLVNQPCLKWYNVQPSEQEIRDIVTVVAARSLCAPSVARNFPQRMGNFALERSCNPSNPADCQYYHPGAKGCYRSINNSGRQAAQCCYNANNTLILGPPGGGSLDFKDSSESLSGHLLVDVLPYIFCCRFSENLCNKYYEKRPSIDSHNFRPPTTRNANGDPHFRTLDGTSYTFNPIGEFTYLTTGDGNVSIQARISQYVDRNGINKPVCFFSGFVMKSLNTDIIQVDLNALKMFTFRINGQPLLIEYGFWSFRGISVDYQNISLMVLHTASGMDLEIYTVSGMLHAILTLPESFKGKINGLIGDWDGNSDNDLKLPNGTWIPVNSSNADIHYKFGMAWATTNQNSLFTYPTGLTWFDYQNITFVPDFSTPPENGACKGNRDCDYDARATGDISLGLSNIAMQNRANELNRINNEISRVCPVQVTVANGNVKEDSYSNGSTISYTVACNMGYKLVGSSSVSCVEGVFQPLGTCESKQSNASSGNTSISLVILLLIFTALISC